MIVPDDYIAGDWMKILETNAEYSSSFKELPYPFHGITIHKLSLMQFTELSRIVYTFHFL